MMMDTASETEEYTENYDKIDTDSAADEVSSNAPHLDLSMHGSMKASNEGVTEGSDDDTSSVSSNAPSNVTLNDEQLDATSAEVVDTMPQPSRVGRPKIYSDDERRERYNAYHRHLYQKHKMERQKKDQELALLKRKLNMFEKAINTNRSVSMDTLLDEEQPARVSYQPQMSQAPMYPSRSNRYTPAETDALLSCTLTDINNGSIERYEFHSIDELCSFIDLCLDIMKMKQMIRSYTMSKGYGTGCYCRPVN